MGITIDKAIPKLQFVRNALNDDMEIAKAYDLAIETMRKYQKITEIVKSWRENGLDYDSCDAMENIERVIEHGNDD